jgi:predicted aldo/keto reductase-like oxidoreductase
MLYRKVGQVDIRASILGFGAMRLPTIGGTTHKLMKKKLYK